MSFNREWAVKAVRKEHRCDACPGLIALGEPAVKWAGMTDGDFVSLIYHPDCREAEVEMNSLKESSWDEWVSLREAEHDDRPWLRAEFPAVAARFDWEDDA